MNFRSGFNFFKQAKNLFNTTKKIETNYRFSTVKQLKMNNNTISILSSLICTNNALVIQNLTELLKKNQLSTLSEEVLSCLTGGISIETQSTKPTMRNLSNRYC